MFGSGASTTLNFHNLPTLVAGGANMGLKHGIYWRGEGETRMSNVHVSILRALGVGQESFSDSTGTVIAARTLPARKTRARGAKASALPPGFRPARSLTSVASSGETETRNS